MIDINIHNVEQIIFENDQIWKKLPRLINYKNQWKLGKLHPELRPLSKRSLLDFLNNLNKEEEKVISKSLNTSIVITKLDYNIVKNYEFEIENLEDSLNILSNEFYSFFIVSRKNNKIDMTFWR